jgi:Tfp pilus assembly protein PilO
MTTRDRLVIVVVLLLAALAGFWFLALAPKRKEAADLQAQIATQTEQLSTAQARAAEAHQAKTRYNDDYAAVAKLGKAVPKSDALPSLVYQLQSVAHSARIDFTSLKISGGGGQGPAPAAAAPAASTGASASGSSSGGSSSSSTPPAPAATQPAQATQAAAAALPPGATVGSAGFPTMPFSFEFDGSFFDMEHFFSGIQRFASATGDNVAVRGRLLTVDAFALTASRFGFPKVKASINATAYLVPQDEGLTAGATPAGPASATPASTTGTSGSPAAAPAAATSITGGAR